MPTTIEDFIEKIYAENPNISRWEMKKKLQAVPDPYRPRKQCWRNITIDNRIRRFYRHLASHSKPAGSHVEGQEIQKHVDIFAPPCVPPEPAVEQGERLDTQDTVLADGDTPTDEKQLSEEEFKIELVSLVTTFKKHLDDVQSGLSDLRSLVKQDFSSLKQDILNLHKKTIQFVPEEVEYDFIELKKPLIEAIKTVCEEQHIDDESDYIEMLLTRPPVPSLPSEEQETMKQESERLNRIISLIRERGGSAFMKFFFDKETNQLSYEEGALLKWGITLRGILAGVAAGVAIGVTLFYSLSALGVPP